MTQIISDDLARDIRASFRAQLDQLNNIEAELEHLDYTQNPNPQGESDAQRLALAIQDARAALLAADDLLRVQVPDGRVFRQPPAAVAFVMRLLRRQGGAR